MDGFHVRVEVPHEEASVYYDRKGNLSTNNLIVVDFNRQITYLLAGWEGSAHDARMLRNARDRGLSIPQGKFVLADGGFANEVDVLVPYRGFRCHMQEFADQYGPQCAEELLNYRLSSMRCIVECVIGILKERWHMLQAVPTYSPDMQSLICRAAAVLHNF